MKWRRQLEQQNMDSAKKIVDPFNILKGKGILAPLDPFGLFNKKSNPAADSINALPIPVPTPPITAANAQVLDAQSAFEKANLLKKSVKNTIWAGDTGGFKPGEAGFPGQAAPAPATYKRG